MDAIAAPQIDIAQGRLRGQAEGGVERFLGIPFAAAPTGARRFAPPGPPPAWTGLREATAFGPEAPTPPGEGGTILGPSGQVQDEDCLSLNVWRPAGTPDAPLPVMVYIHGGGWMWGSGGHPCYDGGMLARHGNLIVVTIQYRLGLLGLLGHEDLAGNEDTADGNWAVRDQVAALAWIHENIAAFGGDPAQVTIFGESAGGMAVGLHCVCPESRRYFRRAVIQSAAVLPVGRAQHHAAAEGVARALGVAVSREALAGVPLADLLAAQADWAAQAGAGRPAPRPMLDGTLVPGWPHRLAAEGATEGLEILVSTTRDEAGLWAGRAAPGSLPVDHDDLRRKLEAGGLPAELADTYREARRARGEAVDALSLHVALQTDRLIRVPALAFLQAHAARGGRGWAARIDWESPMTMPGTDGRAYGAVHTIELPLLFGTNRAAPALDALVGDAPGAEAVTRALQEAWTALARDGDPAAGGTDWPAVGSDTLPTRLFGPEPALAEDPRGIERQAMLAALTASGELA